MTLPSVPQLVVEVAFADDPLTGSPTWTDVSQWVRSVNGVSISRGKQTEVQTTASGSASLVLDNRTRRFDPTFTTGPYYGNLLPRRGIRIRALWNGTYYPMFRGFVEAWPQRYMFKKDASVPLSAYDGLAVLAESEVRSAAVEYLDGLGGLEWFLLNADGNEWHDVQGGAPARLGSGAFATSNIGDLDGNGISFNGGSGLTFNRFYNSTTGSYSFWIQTTAVGPSTTVWDNIFTNLSGSIAGTVVGIGSDGKLYYRGNDYNPSSFPTANTTVRVNTGEPTHICIVHDGNTSIKIYVNGVDQTDTAGYLLDASYIPVVADIGTKGTASPSSDNFTGVIQQFSGSSVAFTAAQVETLYRLGQRVLVQTSAARAERILDDLGWPASLVSLTSTPQAEVAEIPAGTSTALALLQTVADSEQGRLFVAKDGKVTLQDRYWHITSTRGNTVQATFSDDGSDLVYSALGFDFSDREVANRVTVTGSFGATATDEDTGSQADYGLQAQQVSTLLATQGEVVSMASGLIGRRAEPIIRTDAITVQPARQTSQWPTVLGLELGDRIVVELSPVGVSPQLAQTLLVERLDWSITAENWRVAITGSPVPDEDYWVLGVSELGTETRLAW